MVKTRKIALLLILGAGVIGCMETDSGQRKNYLLEYIREAIESNQQLYRHCICAHAMCRKGANPLKPQKCDDIVMEFGPAIVAHDSLKRLGAFIEKREDTILSSEMVQEIQAEVKKIMSYLNKVDVSDDAKSMGADTLCTLEEIDCNAEGNVKEALYSQIYTVCCVMKRRLISLNEKLTRIVSADFCPKSPLYETFTIKYVLINGSDEEECYCGQEYSDSDSDSDEKENAEPNNHLQNPSRSPLVIANTKSVDKDASPLCIQENGSDDDTHHLDMSIKGCFEYKCMVRNKSESEETDSLLNCEADSEEFWRIIQKEKFDKVLEELRNLRVWPIKRGPPKWAPRVETSTE
ncbi:uncharacterized protein NEMAJ01_1663 [Nematocida major]|uniref:uncharacterized protein n=1 Tax=Nematocida major TaxID=1912982 RepID=UPI002008AECB|nr:uncharacterized protein NEMAJ01_1663 [Nematocida major]KAH9386767.1 hypothetical protein NEMAJ01_1663 [Nematocida major]